MISLGEHSYFGGQPILDPFNVEIVIGKYTSIADRLEVIASEHPMKQVSTFPFKEMYELDYEPCTGVEKITIRNDVWIGTGVAIKHGVTIGDGAVIGSKTVVTKDVIPYSIMVGNPVRIIKFRFNQNIVYKLLSIKWWDWDFEFIKANIQDFMDVNFFVNKYFKGEV